MLDNRQILATYVAKQHTVRYQPTRPKLGSFKNTDIKVTHVCTRVKQILYLPLTITDSWSTLGSFKSEKKIYSDIL